MTSRHQSAPAQLRELRIASFETAQVVGGMAFDSAAETYGAALKAMGIATQGVPASALRHTFLAHRDRRRALGAPMTVTEQSVADNIARRLPHAAKIGTAS